MGRSRWFDVCKNQNPIPVIAKLLNIAQNNTDK